MFLHNCQQACKIHFSPPHIYLSLVLHNGGKFIAKYKNLGFCLQYMVIPIKVMSKYFTAFLTPLASNSKSQGSFLTIGGFSVRLSLPFHLFPVNFELPRIITRQPCICKDFFFSQLISSKISIEHILQFHRCFPKLLHKQDFECICKPCYNFPFSHAKNISTFKIRQKILIIIALVISPDLIFV